MKAQSNSDVMSVWCWFLLFVSNLSHQAFGGDNLSLPDWMLWPCKWCHSAICASDWLPKPAVAKGRGRTMLWLDLNLSQTPYTGERV